LVLWLFYVAWIFVFDKDATSNGTRMNMWIRKLPHWGNYRDFFPAKLIKTADLDPTKRYIFGAHPHGIIGLSVWANFCNEYSNFRDLFPGISLRVGTLAINFKIPLCREYFLAIGFVDVNRSTLISLLKKHISVMIVVGGAAESLHARPGNTELIVRKGFVRLAMQTGSSLVPVYSFGENELYDQLPNPEGSITRRIQEWTKQHLGWTVPFFYGRGVWNYHFGLLPRRHPIITVIGNPIDVPHFEEPTEEQVDEYYKLYMDKLNDLFEEYKESANQPEKELKFLK